MRTYRPGWFVASMCFIGLIASARLATAQTSVSIATSRSHARFAVRHLYVERVAGTVPILRGSVVFAEGGAIPSHIEATLDPTGIDTKDRDRDDDLKGPDWFDVRRFPTWSFASSSIAAAPGGFVASGTFVAHGVGCPVTLNVATLPGLPHRTYRATATLDRHAFGMRLTPLDGTIGNELEIVLEIELE